MTDTLKELYANTLGTVSTSLYPTPANTTTILRNIVLANRTSTAAKVTIDVGGIQIVPNVTINGNSAEYIDLYRVIPSGKAINGLSDTVSAIDCTMSGIEVV